jgi:hypothetical protein
VPVLGATIHPCQRTEKRVWPEAPTPTGTCAAVQPGKSTVESTRVAMGAIGRVEGLAFVPGIFQFASPAPPPK